ncbi:unnamed protein product [Ambrosiozyma monospora]|uniref:Unnamed protein product n=1 Tax=Ambrosiozyma monospora TaxID=43982 RepID=A0ACB5U1L8_AMBMO|nr:unnamed protein product [Ambrosiozyma monospora]
MSRAAKATLILSTAFAFTSAIGVYFIAENEKDSLKNGPVKDAARIERRLAESNLNSKQKANLADFEAQKKLREQLAGQQELTGEIIEGKER